MATTTKTKKEINLGPNYSIRPYKLGGVEMTFSEQRERNKEDGTKEDYIFTDKFYFTTVPQALRFFVEREIVVDESIELMLQKTDALHEMIKQAAETFKAIKP